MELDDLQVYQLAMELGEKVWALTTEWDYFALNTVGRQWVRAADSVAANIAEGYGRYHYKENKQYLYYARGSLFETKTWLKKAVRRNLVASETSVALEAELKTLGVKLNNYINSIGPRTTE